MMMVRSGILELVLELAGGRAGYVHAVETRSGPAEATGLQDVRSMMATRSPFSARPCM